MNDTPNVAIRTEALVKEFDNFPAVAGVSFSVPRGIIFGFIGPSGSGKTTTIRMLTGIYPPTSGQARVLGQAPVRFSRQNRARIGYMPQHFALYPDLTIWENLNFAASIYGLGLLKRRQVMKDTLDFVELEAHRRKSVRDISGGMQRRLSLAAALVHDPDLFFLDEPTGGIDPVLRQKFWQHFQDLKAQGKTLFITTQYVSEAAYCDQVGVLVEGQLLTVDSPLGLRTQAFGGDIVLLKIDRPPEENTLKQLQALDFVKKVTHRDPQYLRVSVKHAGTASPKLVKWGERCNVHIVSIEEYLPPFDEVFVALLEARKHA